MPFCCFFPVYLIPQRYLNEYFLDSFQTDFYTYSKLQFVLQFLVCFTLRSEPVQWTIPGPELGMAKFLHHCPKTRSRFPLPGIGIRILFYERGVHCQGILSGEVTVVIDSEKYTDDSLIFFKHVLAHRIVSLFEDIAGDFELVFPKGGHTDHRWQEIFIFLGKLGTDGFKRSSSNHWKRPSFIFSQFQFTEHQHWVEEDWFFGIQKPIVFPIKTFGDCGVSCKQLSKQVNHKFQKGVGDQFDSSINLRRISPKQGLKNF